MKKTNLVYYPNGVVFYKEVREENIRRSIIVYDSKGLEICDMMYDLYGYCNCIQNLINGGRISWTYEGRILCIIDPSGKIINNITYTYYDWHGNVSYVVFIDKSIYFYPSGQVRKIKFHNYRNIYEFQAYFRRRVLITRKYFEGLMYIKLYYGSKTSKIIYKQKNGRKLILIT